MQRNRGIPAGLNGWGCSQSQIFNMLRSEMKKSIRVVAVSHGFGRYNEIMGIGSIANRDEELVPSIGIPQSYATGRRLADIINQQPNCR